MSEDLTRNLPSSDGEKLTQILSTLQRLDSRVERLEPSVERLNSRLGSLEQKVEERLSDTRPIWEKVQVDIADLQAGQQRLTATASGGRTRVLARRVAGDSHVVA